jgi:two-component system C4-dicarboxylate transport sensor histidine kinase DctB
MAVLVLAILLAGLVAAVYLQRRARLVERLAAQAATQDLLERRVAERTADLDRAIDRLQSEVEERRATEAALRRTQAELVQAGKLAALGQMSAALSHEFNQPLAAVKSYAENAATFLDRGRADEARQNITLISTMADRMAAISKHLRNFARRPMEAVGPVRLAEVLDDALALMAARLAGTEVEVPDPGPDLWVTGGHVRLQQVLVNLLSNALDAMERQPDKRIRIGIETAGQEVRLSVRDSGSGLDPEVIPQIFDPFFSTKGPGKGLGLGLSISYNIVRDFGGLLGAANHPEGGAVFTLTLKRADAPRLAAE